MISIFLQGGLGNQLFQIATVIAYSIENKKRCLFTYDEILHAETPRQTYWDNLLKKCKALTNYNSSFVSNNNILSLPKFKEPYFHYVKIPDMNNVIFLGYFQSYKYFDHLKDKVLDIMGVYEHHNIIKNKFELIYKNKVICMHFRLGDYKTKQDYHNILPYEYYKNSLEYLSTIINLNDYSICYLCEKEDNKTIVKITEKLQKNFDLDTFHKIDDEIEDWQQMLFMSCCNINIIANSSFSWWAAYINRHTDKTVLYPQQWFGPKMNVNTNDLFPDNWVKIKF